MRDRTRSYAFRSFLVAACVSFALVSSPMARDIALAQDPMAVEIEPQDHGEPTANFQFDGGSIVECIQQVDATWAHRVNLVVQDSRVNEIHIPAFSLKNVTRSTCMNVLMAVAEKASRGTLEASWINGEDETRSGALVLSRCAPEDLGREPAYTSISYIGNLVDKPEEKEPTDGAKRCDALLGAIEAAFSLDPKASSEKPTLRFHADSGLLMVHATQEQHQLIQTIISEYGSGGKYGQGARASFDPFTRSGVRRPEAGAPEPSHDAAEALRAAAENPRAQADYEAALHLRRELEREATLNDQRARQDALHALAKVREQEVVLLREQLVALQAELAKLKEQLEEKQRD